MFANAENKSNMDYSVNGPFLSSRILGPLVFVKRTFSPAKRVAT
jgi:hypothetical protein